MMNNIHSSFEFGNNLKLGSFCVIEEDVIVGDNVEICNHVLLRKGTRIGNNCLIDSFVISSGSNQIGNNVNIRYQSVIARNVIIEDDVYITHGIKTIYLTHNREPNKEKLIIGARSFIGSSTIIMGGVKIACDNVIGANSLVTKDTEPNAVYIGSPAVKLRNLK